MRVQDNLCVDKVPGRDSSIQSLAKSSGSRHVCKRFGGSPPVISRICGACATQQVRPLRGEPPKRGKADGGRMSWAETAQRFLGLDTSELNSNGCSYVTNLSDRDKIIEIDDMKCLLRSVAVGLG